MEAHAGFDTPRTAPHAVHANPYTGPESPCALTVLASLCAAVVFGAVVWSTYAAFSEHAFDLRQAVWRPVAALVQTRAPERMRHPEAALAHGERRAAR